MKLTEAEREVLKIVAEISDGQHTFTSKQVNALMRMLGDKRGLLAINITPAGRRALTERGSDA